MENDIYNIIIKARNREPGFIEEVIKQFDIQINKYARLLEGEDTKQDMIIYLINVIDKIPISGNNFNNEKAIFSYISKSLRNQYIYLSKKKDVYSKFEMKIDIELVDKEINNEIILLDIFEKLTSKEEYIMKLIYIYGFSVSELAKSMKITRQAVNQCKKRALKKIEEMFC